jgi:hypothetical protein
MVGCRGTVRRVAWILIVLCAVAAFVGQTAVAESAPGTEQVREVYFGETEEDACQPGSKQFWLDELRSLHVCIVWEGLSGTYAAQLKFVTPDGNVYQTMTLAFVTAAAPATVATLEVEGRHHDVKRAGWGNKGESLLVAPLPVAGTYITQHNLTGEWKVEISLDGRSVDQDHFVLRERKER